MTKRLRYNRLKLVSAPVLPFQENFQHSLKLINTKQMKKVFILLSLLAGITALSSCCGSKAAPVQASPSYVAPVK